MASLSDARILITGATSGIGAATAEAFCRAGCKELIVAARREDILKAKAKEWSDEFGTDVAAVVLDVRSRADIESIADQHPNLFDVDILVNNAGLAVGRDPLHEGQFDDWEETFETNVLGLLYVTRSALTHMVKRKNGRGDGHIINLGSVAGRWTYAGGGIYCASKAAVRVLTEGLRMDLLGKEIRVTNIEPGLVEGTEFSLVRFKGDAQKARAVYENTRPLKPEDVAETILWCCSRPAHVNVQELVLYPTDQAAPTMVHRAPN
jgi:3-hydroxy acid dehydrogenase/malonic semialdehyde reductase